MSIFNSDKASKGFTLIELLITITIIATLSLIGYAAFRGVTKGVNDSRRQSDVNAIAKAYENKYQGQYSSLSSSDFVSGSIPKDPRNTDYYNVIASNNSGYKVCAALEVNPVNICNNTSENCFCRSSEQSEINLSGGATLSGIGSEMGLGINHPLLCDANGTLDDGLIGYWNMDEGSGGTTSDITSYGGNANLVNGPIWSTSSVNASFDSAVSFDGSNDYIQAPQNNSLNSVGSGPFTFSLWVNPTSLSWSGLLSKGANWLINGGTGCLRNGNISPSCSYINVPVPLNSWTNVVLTYNPTGGSNNLKAYTQGVFRGSTTSTGNLSVNTLPLSIGGPGGNSYFSGLIDDVRIYNRVLSPEEITNLYGPSGSGCLP